jgi:hypothetical protein
MLHDKEESISKTAELFEIKEKMKNQVTHIEFPIISAW